MSFIELIDLAFNWIFIYCGCKIKRVEVNEEESTEKAEGQIKLLEARLIKVEGQLSMSNKKILSWGQAICNSWSSDEILNKEDWKLAL